MSQSVQVIPAWFISLLPALFDMMIDFSEELGVNRSDTYIPKKIGRRPKKHLNIRTNET